MEKTVNFQLTDPTYFQKSTKVFVKGEDGKISQRSVIFTKKGSKNEKKRTLPSIKSEFARLATTDPTVIEGLKRSASYGRKWIIVGDDNKTQGLSPYSVSADNEQIAVLKYRLDQLGETYPSDASYKFLQELYNTSQRVPVSNKGTKDPLNTEHKNIDIPADLEALKNEARATYATKYGKDLPAEFNDDSTLLTAINGNPDFDCEKYMADANATDDGDDRSLEELQKAYFAQEGKNVATSMKNNAEWIKSKLK